MLLEFVFSVDQVYNHSLLNSSVTLWLPRIHCFLERGSFPRWLSCSLRDLSLHTASMKLDSCTTYSISESPMVQAMLSSRALHLQLQPAQLVDTPVHLQPRWMRLSRLAGLHVRSVVSRLPTALGFSRAIPRHLLANVLTLVHGIFFQMASRLADQRLCTLVTTPRGNSSRGQAATKS